MRDGGRSTRREFVALAGGGLAFAAASCAAPGGSLAAAPSGGAAPAGAAAAAASARASAAPTPLQYGSISKTAWEWHRLISFDQGFLARAGFAAENLYFRTPANGVQMLTAGALDFASINPETVIRSVINGAPVTVIASDTNLAPYSLIVQPDIRSFADIRGKTLPSSGPREQTTVWMKQVLKANGVNESEYDFVVVGGTPERMAAIRSGAVAGGFIGQPQDFQLMADGYRRLALLSEYVNDHPISVHAGRNEWLQAHPGQAVAALRGIREAVRWLYDPTNKEEAIAILAREIEVAEPLARQTYTLLVEQLKVWDPNLAIPTNGVQKSIDFMTEIGELTPPIPPSDRFVDRRYIEEVNR
jgi:ABC-type nitrate/sulfonate/bicarbonate transport system substrate-binding protein